MRQHSKIYEITMVMSSALHFVPALILPIVLFLLPISNILYLQKLALTSPTTGYRSVIIVRSWTKATEFVFCFFIMRGWYNGTLMA
jgi:hypothetical protein